MTNSITLIDYGLGNLFSVSKALEQCGAKVLVTSDPTVVRNSSRILLPGVGAFENGINELRNRGLDESLKFAAGKGVPLLGVCLGMQLLLNQSEEFGLNEGLGLIPGKVIAIPSASAAGKILKVPHIGWNEIFPSANCSWKNSILEDIESGSHVYFVHSFMVCTDNQNNRLADTDYEMTNICAAISSNNIYGTQFHPEKSGPVGLKILNKFMTL